jgi:DNA polymerase III subunit delta'
MESLFDASEFEGSLFDVSLFDASLSDPAVEPAVVVNPPEAEPVSDDPSETPEAVESPEHTEAGPDDGDVTEALNDPSWEPPLDEINEGRAGFWSEIVGQDSAVALLQASVPAPVHAYLFVGAAGSGKQAAALRFGAALVCPYSGCGRCNVCARALIRAHPDVLVVEREGASITVDQAREIIRLAARAPMEGDRKVLILVDFHLVTQAAPTLLKIIEEPPPSTVFVVLAEQVTAELVTIASRCVTVTFAPLSSAVIIHALVYEGASAEVAAKAAEAAGGRLDRARLLATDPQLGQRVAFWQGVPSRLDGSGSAVAVLAAEALAMLDAAAVGPLEARQAVELETLEARLEATGGRGGVGQRKELLERHKRELKRLRDDEVRLGLGAIQQIYRRTLKDPLAAPSELRASLAAIERINTANGYLVRNPNLLLWLQALFLDLSRR